MSSKGRRRVAIWGGLLAGLGLGTCLAWVLNIFEIAHPENATSCSGYDCSLSLYPNPVWTVLVLLIFCGAIGVGLGLVASALIRDEDVRSPLRGGSQREELLAVGAQRWLVAPAGS